MTTTTTLLNALPPAGRERLMELSREAVFSAGARIFEQGRRADRFWIIRTGRVDLDVHVPGRQAAVIDTLVPGDLLGWSWLSPPRAWHLGAQAASAVSAYEFDAAAVLALCDEDPVFGQALARRVAEIIGHRLHRARVRLLDIYGPYGSGPTFP
jgi:CRP-like cAMP-binding protein